MVSSLTGVPCFWMASRAGCMVEVTSSPSTMKSLGKSAKKTMSRCSRSSDQFTTSISVCRNEGSSAAALARLRNTFCFCSAIFKYRMERPLLQ